MKKTVLKKPTLVLMAGLPGVGKSTLARRLGELSGWVVLEKDKLKEPLLKDDALKEKVDEDTAGWIAYDSFFEMAEDILLNQRLSVILDSSALLPFILKHATELADRSRARLKIVLCYVDEPTRQRRLHTREAKRSQFRAYRITEEAFKQFDNLPADISRIHTKDGSLEEYAQEALAYIKKREPVDTGVLLSRLVALITPAKGEGLFDKWLHFVKEVWRFITCESFKLRSILI